MSYIKDLFSENTNASMARVLAAVCILTGCFIAVYSIHIEKDMTGTVVSLIGVGAGLKIGNKFAENGERGVDVK